MYLTLTHAEPLQHLTNNRLVLVLAAGLMVFGLTGCAARSEAWSYAQAVWAGQSVSVAVEATAQGKGLNPQFRYLHVQADDGPAAVMVLGYAEDQAPANYWRTWYSAQQEHLQLVTGRIATTSGLATDWAQTQWPQGRPTWASAVALAHGEHLATFSRLTNRYLQADALDPERQLLSYGIVDNLTVSRVAFEDVPQFALPRVGSEQRWSKLIWLREGSTAQNWAHSLPDAWYAFDPQGIPQLLADRLTQGDWTYSFQCLNQFKCLHMHQWPLSWAQQ